MINRNGNNSAWATEMRAAQEAALPTAVVDQSGTGVFLVAGSADSDLIDADPAPGVQPRWQSKGRGDAMGKVADNQLSQPTITVPLATSAVKTQGTFAGPVGNAFTICHLAGNKFWFQGGEFTFQRLVGITETEDGDSYQYETQEVVIPSRAFFADNSKTVVIGFEVDYGAQSGPIGPTPWRMEFTLSSRTVSNASEVNVSTGTVCGMRLDISGTPPDTVGSLTPIGDNFFPFIALHTVSDNVFWQQQLGFLPNQYINPNKGFIWWP